MGVKGVGLRVWSTRAEVGNKGRSKLAYVVKGRLRAKKVCGHGAGTRVVFGDSGCHGEMERCALIGRGFL